MKLKFLLCSFVALLAFTACSDEDKKDGPGGGSNPLTISGTLAPASAVRATEAATQSFVATLGSDNKTLSGKLKDGSVTFELSGYYNTATGVFSMQAPSSIMIFSIAGQLDANENIVGTKTSASVKIKNASGEWSSTDLAVTASDVEIVETPNADMTGVTSIPRYLQGELVDQIMLAAEMDLSYFVTDNAITMYDGDLAPRAITVVEITNADGTAANESGPWNLIVSAKYYVGDNAPIDYVGKFYISKTFDAKLSSEIGGAKVNDLFFGDDLGQIGATDISVAIPTLGSAKAYVAPYCSNQNVSTVDIYPQTGFSPAFVGASATANAKAATTLKAISGFTLVLK